MAEKDEHEKHAIAGRVQPLVRLLSWLKRRMARTSEWERVTCDICGQKISRRKGVKALVHTTKMGTQYVHAIHVIRNMFSDKKKAI